MIKHKRIGVLTSGGDSPGMNAAIRGVVRSGIHNGHDVIGIQKGYKGLVDKSYCQLSLNSVGGILMRGGTFLQTSRCPEFHNKETRKIAYENYENLGLDALVVIGGDGSLRALHDLVEDFGVQGIGLPGTIDNDLYGTEFTIGFDTALNTAMGIIDKIKDTASSHSRLFIVEVMGRNSGYIALFTAIATGAEDVLIPEAIEDLKDVKGKIEKGWHRGKTNSLLIVAEGDQEGGAEEVRKKMIALAPEWDTRMSVIGHVQRGGSPTAIDRLLSSRLGHEAIQAIDKGLTDKMIGLTVPDGHVIYTDLKDTWEKQKSVPQSWRDVADILSK